MVAFIVTPEGVHFMLLMAIQDVMQKNSQCLAHLDLFTFSSTFHIFNCFRAQFLKFPPTQQQQQVQPRSMHRKWLALRK